MKQNATNDKNLVSEISAKIASKWHIKGTKPKHPTLALIGGFQGAGKTTVLELLQKEIPLIVISPDVIRHELFGSGMSFSKSFKQTVSKIKNNLLRQALSSGHHIAIDQLLTPQRASSAKKVLVKEKIKKYKIITVYLKTSPKVLLQRVSIRQPLPETYTGTVSELKASLQKHKSQNLSSYDLVINTQEFSPPQIGAFLKHKVFSP